MTPLFKKLNLRDQTPLLIVGAPDSLQGDLSQLTDRTLVFRIGDIDRITFALVFVQRQAEVDRLSRLLAPRCPGDPILWFAYPKGTSRTYECDFNRDTGWSVLRGLGFDTVRQVAIDSDWTALRFRRSEHILR